MQKFSPRRLALGILAVRSYPSFRLLGRSAGETDPLDAMLWGWGKISKIGRLEYTKMIKNEYTWYI